jgi:integral membrane protein
MAYERTVVTNPAPLAAERSPQSHPSPPRALRSPPGSRLVRVGLVVFGLGLVAIVATFIGYAAGEDNRPLGQNLLCLLAPLGFGLALIGLVRNGRADARRVAALYPTAARPAFTRLPRPSTARALMRWVAIAEATSWLLLIVATIVKFAFGQPFAVQILGPIHGTLFLAYLGVVAAAWWSLRWSIATVVVVVIDSFLPGGGLLVARRRDLRPGTD